MQPHIVAAGCLLLALAACTAPPEVGQAERPGRRLTLAFADPAWDGQRIPAGQQCAEQGGAGQTPALQVRGIPAAAREVIVEFYDDTQGRKQGRSWSHGKIGFRHSGGSVAAIPSVPAYATAVPDGRVVANSERRPGYHPPCSGGIGHSYSAVVVAVDPSMNVLASGRIVMGTY